MKITYNLFFVLSLFFCITSCSPSSKQKEYSQQDIKEGIATLSGQIIGNDVNFDDLSLTVEFTDPLAGFQSYVIPVNKDGFFSQAIPCNQVVFGYLMSEVCNSFLLLCPNELTTFNITLTTLNDSLKNNDLELSISSTSINELDMNDIDRLIMKIFNIEGGVADITEDMSADEVRNKIRIQISRIQDSINMETHISEYSRKTSFNYLKLVFLEAYVRNSPKIHTLVHYNFLQDFNIDDRDYLSFDEYYKVLQRLLENSVLNIPAIEDLPILEWQDSIKNTIGDILGASDGLFYDVLTINGYRKQLNEGKTLSTTQKENIEKYFTNEVFTKGLLKANEDLIAQLANKELNIHISALPVENGIGTIIDPFKGKVVVVDFWATWCGPCIANMNKTRNLKETYKNKDVVFLYITNESSNRNQWKDRINMIGGNHYYLSYEAWEVLANEFGIRSIPYYLIYDKNGKLQYSGSAMDGDMLNSWIERFL